MPRVAFFLHPRSLITSVTLPAEMMRSADHYARVSKRAASDLIVKIATLDGKPVPAFDRMSVDADCAFSDLEDIDLLFMPSLFRNPLPSVRQSREILPALRRLSASNAMICSSGTGACFTAEAGLLDEKPATTHWFFLDEFARRYPRVDLKRDHLITRAGNQYCAGSLNALADLSIYFIDLLYGPGVALNVASQFSPEIRRPYLSQGFIDGENNPHFDEVIIDAQQWLVERATEKVCMGDLAARLGISQRTLNRRFQEAVGMSPIEYQRDLRIRLACDLLSKTNLPIARIGADVGYPDKGYFCSVFRKRVTTTPSAYRRAVRRKLFRLTQSGPA